ncbi:hypothetical protein HK099_005021 [Clydaea vesicula]|uniref:Uncharacterized protein n=1 Tax=Clydaea vesicula TaxID=447962 RepID=A0AAD5XV88_9FUNG|nr:hypothetical protein HK099_005021 [Clydaea vesicula]
MTKSGQTITEQISQTASDAYNKVKNTVMPEQSKTAGDKLDEGISATKDKKDSAADQTKGFFSEKSEQANDKIQSATKGKPVTTKVKENLEGAKDYVAEKANNVKDYSKKSANFQIKIVIAYQDRYFFLNVEDDLVVLTEQVSFWICYLFYNVHHAKMVAAAAEVVNCCRNVQKYLINSFCIKISVPYNPIPYSPNASTYKRQIYCCSNIPMKMQLYNLRNARSQANS